MYFRQEQDAFPGKSAVLNDALKVAKGEAILVFDADAIVEKDFSKTTNELGKIISTLKNPAVTALAIYLLQQLSTVCPADFEKYKTETDKTKNKLLVSYSKKKFHAAAEEEKTQTYCVIVSSLLAQAETAIYG